MKKIFAGMLAISLILCLVACGGNQTDNDSNRNDSNRNDSSVGTTQNDNQSQNGQDIISDPVNELLSSTYKVPGKNIYIDVPNYKEMEKAFTELFIVHGVKYVAFTAVNEDLNNGEAVSLSAVHESAFETFMFNIQNYSYVNQLNIETDKTSVINGCETYRYEGTLNCGRDTIYDAYVVGYSFIMDDIACNITGSVIDQTQSQELIDEIESVVEAMIQTVRSEK